jgi:hypothetical protein
MLTQDNLSKAGDRRPAFKLRMADKKTGLDCSNKNEVRIILPTLTADESRNQSSPATQPLCSLSQHVKGNHVT